MKEMSRIIFVGIHNKPGMEPLDSRTKSGKIIDEVIIALPEDITVIKTNLLDCDEIPDKDNTGAWFDRWVSMMIFDWVERVKLRKTDTVVLLGKDVQEYFRVDLPIRKIPVPHPASRHIKPEQYIKDLIEKIKSTDTTITNR